MVGTTHGQCRIENGAAIHDNLLWSREQGHPVDAIINCAGVLPGRGYYDTIMTNSIGPHNLATFGVRLVHMSTDCVFSGRKYKTFGGFDGYGLDSSLLPDPVDLYGRSKLLGEPRGDHVVVVRGSFIGEGAGFLGWLLSASGQVQAWERAHWNGTSVAIMAEKLVELAEGSRAGIVHVASTTQVSKAFMVTYLAEKLRLLIEPVGVVEPAIWRVLLPDIEVLPVEEMLDGLIEELRAGCVATASSASGL